MKYPETEDTPKGPQVLGMWYCPDDTSPEYLLLKSDYSWSYLFESDKVFKPLNGPSWIDEYSLHDTDSTFFAEESFLLLPLEFISNDL